MSVHFGSLSRLVSVVVPLALWGCGEDPVAAPDADNTGGGTNAHCNPLAAEGECAMPWPSNAFTVVDGESATGRRLDLPADALPINIDEIKVDPAPWNRWDGFSAVGPLLARFPGGVDATGLPTFADPDASLAAAAPIILMNLATGERVPYFAEVDMGLRNVADRALIIRPLRRLAGAATFGVAIRTTVRGGAGGDLPVSPGFAAIRDGRAVEHPRWQAATADIPAFLDRLEAAGVARSDLVLAWTFSTASDAFMQGDLLHMRDAALAAAGAAGANLTVSLSGGGAGTVVRRFTGTFTSPNFLTEGTAAQSVLRRDATGRPEATGMRNARIAAVVPNCVNTQPLPRPVVLFGHGIFATGAGHMFGSVLERVAAERCFILLAGDFIGLSAGDISLAPYAANNINGITRISEKLAQSVIDFIMLAQAARGPLQTASGFQVGGQPVIDPERVYLVGLSLGGTMAGTILAYEPTISRAVLQVPGGNWSMLLERSATWQVLQGTAQGAYPEPRDAQLLVALLGMQLELVDPITTAAHVTRNPLPGSRTKQLLLWETHGDALINNLTTEMTAREYGIPVLGPTVKAPWGFVVETGPSPSGMMIFDEHPQPMPTGFNTPINDNGTHSTISGRAAATRALVHFLDQGQAINGCRLGKEPAPCDCATAACD